MDREPHLDLPPDAMFNRAHMLERSLRTLGMDEAANTVRELKEWVAEHGSRQSFREHYGWEDALQKMRADRREEGAT